MIEFKKIEKKWQSKWEKSKIFQSKEKYNKKKYFVLEMFPYPSSQGLHIGHARNYIIGDVYARYKRMNGFNVLYPMGYDSFGLPAENAAIKANSHPKIFTETAIKNFIKQQKSLGLSYDWSRLIMSHDPNYYKWDQWIFLQLLKKGLAYKKKSAVNWCPKCKTVLANEQVSQGKCWRHEDTDVEIIELEQWFFKITDYADSLLKDLEKLEWPEDIKTMQRNWIGKSEGTLVNFKLENGEIMPVFTTRPDTLFGVTFMVFAPEHPKVLELVKGTKHETEVKKFINKVVLEERFTRAAKEKEKEGMFIGKYATNPVNNEKIPIYIANFVLMDYGTGFIMAVPAHDQRDFEFAKKYNIPIKVVIQPKEINCIVVHGSPEKEKPNEPKENERHWLPWIKKELEKQGIKTYLPLMPTPWNPKYEEWKKEFDKLPVNENSILIGHSAGTAFLVRWLGDTNKKIKKLILIGPGKISSHERTRELYDFKVNKNIKNLVDEIIIFISNDAQHHIDSARIYEKGLNGKFIEIKNKGHFTFGCMKTHEFPELLQTILGMEEAYIQEGILINSNKFNGLNNKKAINEITKYLESKKLGKKTIQYKLRDWLISRQRYWGCPIPIIYCDKCGIVPVPEKDLPVRLPEKVSFKVEGNPLASSKEFINTKCPKCSSPARRETDTIDTFIDSSWYFLRYCDPKNNKKIFDSKKANYWLPINQYIGGKEHACGHLIYFRFITKFLHDLNLIKYSEPAKKLFNQGMVCKGGFVMSKSRGNVITPEEISEKYGIDTARLFLTFVAAPDKDMEWSDQGIQGMSRFVNKILSLADKKFLKESKLLTSKLNRTIKEVTENIEKLQYNLAIIKLMEFTDYLHNEEISKNAYETLLKLLAPFAPHICEELWNKLGHKKFISLESWLKYNPKKIDEKSEKEYELIQKTISDIHQILKLIKTTPKSVYIYLIPKELELFNKYKEKISKKLNLEIRIFAVNDKNKYDPQNKSSKSKLGKPAIYLE